MTKKIMATSVVMGTMFMFSGCGSSDTPTTTPVATGTAYYIDAAVSGVNYKCGSTEGITDTDGAFTFEVDSSCTFYLGDIELRGVDAGLLVDGESIYETDVEIARILQSLDSDGDPSNGITIDAEIVAAIEAAGITELPDTVAEMDEMLAIVEAEGGTVVSEDDAMEHMLTTLLGGKTFYDVGQQVSDATDTWSGEVTFNADLTEISYTGSGSTEAEVVPISVTGNRLVFGQDTDGSYTLIGENKGDYIEFKDYYNDGTLESNTRLYFDKTKADEYFATIVDGYVVITEAMLSGKTFYNRDFDDNGYGFGAMTMTDTVITRHEIWYDSDDTVREDGDNTFSIPYALVNGIIRVDVSQFEEGYFWFTLTSENESVWNVTKENDLEMNGAEGIDTQNEEWFLSKPTDFPESL